MLTPQCGPVYCFHTSSDRPCAINLLVYMSQKLKHSCEGRVDFVDGCAMGGWVGRDNELPPYAFMLGEGTHTVRFEESVLTVVVEAVASDKGDSVSYNTSSGVSMSRRILVSGLDNSDQMQRLLKAASEYMAMLISVENDKRASQFVFDSNVMRMFCVGPVTARSRGSVFLKAGQADRVFGAVRDFLASKADYDRCFMPYKLNALLYGTPGSGKTSLITSVASEFNLSTAIIPFSPTLTDGALSFGLRKAREVGCRLLVLEDVDCLFDESRKPHDAARSKLTLSGLLNSMDGMVRGSSDGLLMFLTANCVACIDAAVLRSARIDLSVEFTHADEHQTKACYDFYASTFGWANENWASFWEGIRCFQFSTALLQQYFFQRRTGDLCVEEFKAMVHGSEKNGMVKNLDGERFYL